MPEKSSLSTLKGRMLLLWLLPSIVAIILVILINAYNELSMAKARAERMLLSEVTNTAKAFQVDNLRAVQTAKTMALAQRAGLLGQREASLEYARQVLIANPEFTGAYFGYEPNADGQDEADSNQKLATGATNAAGRFLPYWYRDGANVALDTLVDMESSLYYNGVKNLFLRDGAAKGMVTEPYSYQGVMIVEQVFPIVVNNRFMGIAGVDRALDYIDDLLRGLKDDQGNNYLLLSRNNKVIANTVNSEFNTRDIGSTAYSAFLSPLLGSVTTSPKVLQQADPVSGEDSFFVAAAIPIGDWKLVQITSVDSVMGPLYSNVLRTLGLALLAVIFVVAVSYYFVNSITRRVSTLVDKANKVSEGDIDAIRDQSTVVRQDEIDDLTVNINRVVESYRGITRMTSAIAQGDFSVHLTPSSSKDAVSQSLNDMAVKRKEMELALREHAQLVKHKSSSQVDAIQSVSAAIHQMNASIGEVAQVASNASQRGEMSVSAVSDVKKLISDVTLQANKLSDEMTRTSEAVSEVSQSTENINRIVDVINGIAEQTNLLALNAAIEAARAGEQGRGFAVVADEVRTLAARTQQSTEEIRNLISRLGVDVTRSVDLVQAGVGRAQTSAETAELADTSLSNVTQQINDICDLMIQVAAAVEQQQATSSEINNNMSNIYDAAQELSNMSA